MAKTRLSDKALFVERGYGQVEPNHLSAQRTGQIYAQLPAHKDISVLENGQFVVYDYAKGVVNTLKTNEAAKGEWMLVFNEVKLYRDHEDYNDFAMKKEDYVARVYSPGADVLGKDYARKYEGVVNAYEHDITSTTKPFEIEQRGTEIKETILDKEYTFTVPYAPMAEGTNMVPRVFKTNVGDIFTTNTIAEESVDVNDILSPNADGYLSKEATGDMQWIVVKKYTLADRQRAVKIMRIA
jgi:hypothetical protein